MILLFLILATAWGLLGWAMTNDKGMGMFFGLVMGSITFVIMLPFSLLAAFMYP